MNRRGSETRQRAEGWTVHPFSRRGSRACRRFWLGPGLPASHAGYRLRLLPSGPDLVRGPTLRRTWPSTPPVAALAPRAGPSSGNSAPLERVADYRAPLIPRLARSTVIVLRNELVPRLERMDGRALD